MAVMLDLLLGSPGESKESIEQTVELVRKAGPDCAGVSLGVRVYPGTELALQVASKKHAGGLTDGEDFFDPRFFLEPQIAPFASDWLSTLIGDDRRFFFFDPSRPTQNYNYNSNSTSLKRFSRDTVVLSGISSAVMRGRRLLEPCGRPQRERSASPAVTAAHMRR